MPFPYAKTLMTKFFTRDRKRSIGHDKKTQNGFKCINGRSPRKSSVDNPSLDNKIQHSHEGKVCEDDQGKELFRLEDSIVLAPYRYMARLPSKKVRETFIQAMNIWIQVPEPTLESIKSITTMLHQSSLMFDDIEDESQLRRGKPATHVLYGPAQTINSAVYVLVNAFSEIHRLNNPEATVIFVDELQNLHRGQSLDLYWKYHSHAPSVEDYMKMVDNKTGGLFRLCVRLIQATSCSTRQIINMTEFTCLLGRYFQIRDDYQNLMSAEYSDQKGFCEDLDEGKISLPVIYYMQSSGLNRDQVRVLLFRQQSSGKAMSYEMKLFILAAMKENGAIEKTYIVLQTIQDELLTEFNRLEAAFGLKNPILEGILRKLWV